MPKGRGFTVCFDKGLPVYLLVDASGMNTSLPEHFLESVRNSAFIHPNMIHAAVFMRSPLLKNVFTMVAKLTRQRNKLSIHDSYDQAMTHLQKLVKEAGL